MTQLLMDENDDVAIVNNRMVMTVNNSDEEIRQRLIQRLKKFAGEWFLDINDGVPYFQAVFVKGTPADIIESIFKDVIIGTDGVDFLKRFEPLDLSGTRELTVDFDVQTINGTELQINEVLP